MRVISGSARGHKLKCIKGLNTRPTQDRVKESIFNIIMNYINDSIVLDLFSGTGNLGIEALSRGAKYSIMVDSNFSCVNIINENLQHTKMQGKARVIKGDVISVIRNLNQKFDLIFMDPPYNKNLIIPVLNEIHNFNVLHDDGIIVIERSADDEILDMPFKLVREKDYGGTIVSFLKKEIE